MDVDIEELKNLLHANGLPEDIADNEEFDNYITQLCSCGVEKLGRESSHINEEKNAVLTQTRNLVFENYKTFIHSADCSRAIFKEFGSVEDHLGNLIHGLETLKTNVEDFVGTSRNLSQSRQTTSLTLSKHTQLLEILELPQLMDTCVRNGYYEDALEILAYVKRMEKKNLDVAIIANIVNEVKGGTRLMLLQLLMQLRSSLTLPQCLKVVGLLRRLDVFTEAELRLKFLQARDSWFSSLLKNIPKDDAYQHITKVIEMSRVHLFDIITQYRAIFSDEDPRYDFGDNNDVNEQAIYQGWIIHKVNQFLGSLEKDLSRGVGPNMESLMAQCMFFGQSLSRIGADFRNLLVPIFQKAVFSKFESNVRAANFKFDESLSSFSLMETIQPTSSSFLAEAQDKASAPIVLGEYLPLGHYMNGLINAFNELRQCCPLGVLKSVLTLLHSSISKVILALVDLHQLESSGFTAMEEKSFTRMCQLLATILIPHVNVCLSYIFPLQNISDVAGVPLVKLQKQKVAQLNLELLIEPIEAFLPKKLSYDEESLVVEEFPDNPSTTGSQRKDLEEINPPILTTDETEMMKSSADMNPDHFGMEENPPKISENDQVTELLSTNE